MRDFGCYDFHAEVMESISRGLAESRRHAIRFLYEYIYGAPPEHDDDGISLWNGPEGVNYKKRLSKKEKQPTSGQTSIRRCRSAGISSWASPCP